MATSTAPGSSVRHNLPASFTSFIGRERELTDVQTRLAGVRLVTLTGVGGCGKTRLALEVARAVLDRYPDGVWLVELASLADTALVPQTVAAVFDMREVSGQPVATALAAALCGRRLLLVLDNCEHLLDGCAQLVDTLLRACPELRVLATSREALGITGEIAWRVPSLPVPDAHELPPFAELEQNPAVRLFVERAAAVQPHFVLTERNAPVVAQVCKRLDGIPLALELAAARIEALTPDQVAARLNQRFRLLTGGSRTALPRQQTLHATLDWSYALLSEPEQHLFNRLSVFAGGWTLEAAEVVCSDDGIEQDDMLDLLERLVRKSLVVAEEGGDDAVRYRLLETLRQFAHERLVTAGEAETVHQRHASYCLALAEEVGPRMYEWAAVAVDRLVAEHDNMRAAMRWFSESNAVEQAVRLGGQLWGVWVFAGYLTEGRAQLRTLLALPGASHASPAWARLVYSHGLVEYYLGDYAASRASFEHVAPLQRALGDPLLATTLGSLGQTAREQEDYAAARTWLEEGLALAEQLDLQLVVGHALGRLGTIAQALGDYTLAQTQFEESLAVARRVNDRIGVAWALYALGCLALDQDDYLAARVWLSQGLTSFPEFDRLGFVHGLAMFAALAAAERLPAAALRLAGATTTLTHRTGILVQHSDSGRYERWLASARQALSEEVAAAAWAEGQQMRLDQAIAYALAPSQPVTATAGTPAASRRAQTSDQLTQRQREVAALIAQGRSNRQIGEELVISERTVAAHVEQILNKLGFASRTQIGVWAAEHGLHTPSVA
jgi:predicted ATPase/DNA-binding CsgD family transcriptional regulator